MADPIDDRTEHLDLPLPHIDNLMTDDVPRLREALNGLDAALEELESAGFVTSAELTAAISNILNAAPAALDTLNELAAALGDDPDFAATLAGQIGDINDALDALGVTVAARLVAASNLSDLASASTALTNLGLTSNAKSLVTAANYAAMKALLAIAVADVAGIGTIDAVDNLLATGSNVVRRHSDGRITASHFHQTHAAAQRDTDDRFMSSNDGFIRQNTKLGMRKSLGLNTDYIMGAFNGALDQYNATQRIIPDMPYPGVITAFTHRMGAGAITVAVRINGVAVTGLSAVAVGTTKVVTAATGANVVAAGNYIEIVISGAVVTDEDFHFEITFERT